MMPTYEENGMTKHSYLRIIGFSCVLLLAAVGGTWADIRSLPAEQSVVAVSSETQLEGLGARGSETVSEQRAELCAISPDTLGPRGVEPGTPVAASCVCQKNRQTGVCRVTSGCNSRITRPVCRPFGNGCMCRCEL